MKLMLVLLACALAAVAQTLVGLPEYGVTLSGAANPTIENHSGKTIIASLVIETHANGRVMVGRNYHPIWIQPGQALKLAKDSAYIPGYSDSPITTVKLMMLIFADGEVVGQDPYENTSGDFKAGMQKRFQNMIDSANLAMAGDWAELTRRSQLNDFDHYFTRGPASEMILARDKSGESAVRDLAQKYQSLPGNLWRAKKN
jgi:hypothetical protein